MVGQGRNNLDSPRQAAKGPADTENDNAELAEDADIEDFDEEAVAKALADYLAENDLDGAVSILLQLRRGCTYPLSFKLKILATNNRQVLVSLSRRQVQC